MNDFGKFAFIQDKKNWCSKVKFRRLQIGVAESNKNIKTPCGFYSTEGGFGGGLRKTALIFGSRADAQNFFLFIFSLWCTPCQ